MNRLLPAWTLAKSNRSILGTQIPLYTPSFLNSLLLLTDVIQPLKNNKNHKTTGRIYLSPKPGARRSAPVVLTASPLFFTTLRSDIYYVSQLTCRYPSASSLSGLSYNHSHSAPFVDTIDATLPNSCTPELAKSTPVGYFPLNTFLLLLSHEYLRIKRSFPGVHEYRVVGCILRWSS